ncbi:GNAT family N-acetyltransferase [Diplocloster modestus]|nr:GNAT family N-acetyltransferase [Diplocloster modestus]
MRIRPIKKEEILLLTDFVYEAIYQRDAKNPLPRTVIQDASIWIYIDRFGSKKDDHCLVAEVDSYVVGACWVRRIKAFGHVEESVPEFAISVYPQYRGMGVGTELMKEMLLLLRRKVYAKASLAVQKDNYAVSMYKKAGFEIMDENEQEYIMVCNLNGPEIL